MELPISLNPNNCIHNNPGNFHYTEKACVFCKYIIRFRLLIGYVLKAELILKIMQTNLNVAILQSIFVEKLCIDSPVSTCADLLPGFSEWKCHFFRYSLTVSFQHL